MKTAEHIDTIGCIMLAYCRALASSKAGGKEPSTQLMAASRADIRTLDGTDRTLPLVGQQGHPSLQRRKACLS